MKWIFLPGMDGSGEFFEPFLKTLPEGVEVETVGFPAEEKLGYDELLSWLLPRLPKDEPFLVVAESFSGPLAVRLAAEEPAGMVGAVVSASFVRHPLPRCLRWLPLAAIFRLVLPKGLVRFALADDAAMGPSLYEAFYQVMRYSPPEVLAHRARAALQIDGTNALKGCRLPLLFLEGTRDRLIPRSTMQLVRKLRPDLPVVAIAGPHFLLQLKPEECLRSIEAFLEEIKDRATRVV